MNPFFIVGLGIVIGSILLAHTDVMSWLLRESSQSLIDRWRAFFNDRK
jgi:hypothetical protein